MEKKSYANMSDFAKSFYRNKEVSEDSDPPTDIIRQDFGTL